jgi:GT2 family glycosyltransferase/glycosyltransferase involved in cell wall biosynthesis
MLQNDEKLEAPNHEVTSGPDLVVVLGMHRSGTSLVTKSLELFGCEFGSNLMPAQADNPKGFWEDLDVVEFNDQLLKQLDSKWDFPALLIDKNLDQRFKSAIPDAKQLLSNKMEASNMLAIKDPRISLLLPFWEKVFRSMSINVAYILVYRNPVDVAASLEYRNGFGSADSLDLWYLYNFACLRVLGGDFVVVDYHKMIHSPEEQLGRIGRALGVSSVDKGRTDEFIKRYVDKSLCHSYTPLDLLARQVGKDDEVYKLASLLDWLSTEESESYESKIIKKMLGVINKDGDVLLWRNARYGMGYLNRSVTRLMRLESVLIEKNESLADRCSHLVNQFEMIAQQNQEHNAKLVSQQQKVECLGDRVSECFTAVKQGEEQNSKVGKQLGRLNKRVEEQFGLLDGRVTEDFNRLDEQIERVNDFIDRVGQIQSAVLEQDNVVKRQAQELQKLEEKVASQQEVIARQGERLSVIEHSQSSGKRNEPLLVRANKGERLSMLARFLKEAIAHPATFFRMVNLSRIKNLVTILFKRPELSQQVFGRYIEYMKSEAISALCEPGVQSYPVTPCRASANATHRTKRKRISPEPQLMEGEPEVSIVIPVYNKIDFTIQCLESIVRFTHGATYEVIVVDDCSTDETPRVLENYPGIRFYRNDQNQGFIASCNVGARCAKGKYVVLLNNDTEVLTNWLLELLDTFTLKPDAGMVGSKLIYPNGVLQEAGGIIWQDGSAWNYGRGQSATRPEFNYLREVDYLSGACIMLAKDLWDTLGGFDDHFSPAYGEDSDLAFRVRDKGYKVYYQPMSEVIHYEGISSGTDVNQGVKAYQTENAKKLFARWKHVLKAHRPNGVQPEYEKERDVCQRMLVIDAVTPTPDKDAGSITALGIMELGQELGYKVTFVPESNFTWIPGYSDHLARIGIESIVYPYYKNVSEILRQRGAEFDAVVVFRCGIASKYLDDIRAYAPQARVIFHASDLHFMREERGAKLNLNVSEYKNAERTKKMELAVVASVDCTIVHSEAEKTVLENELTGANVVLFPWMIDVKKKVTAFSDRVDVFYLGGYQHRPNVDAVKYFVEEIWPLASPSLPGVQFLIVGSNAPDELRKLESKTVRFVGYVETLDELMTTSRVSVVPLRYGAGIKGKIGTSMAYGVPCVTTSIGAEGMSLRNGENVLVADEAKKFAEALVGLYTDQELWERLSNESLQYVEDMYSRTRALGIMQEVLAVDQSDAGSRAGTSS